VGADGFKIGLAWQGAPGGDVDHGRSMPLSVLAPLADVPGVRLISLQKGSGEEQINQVSFRDRVETLGSNFDGGPDAFLDTAAVIMCLDLIITTDTSIPHLAGALGRPFWLLLKKAPNWRWLYSGDQNPFYPTAKLFRQDVIWEWGSVVVRVVDELGRMVAVRSSAKPDILLCQ
jgi:hypothetical protein